MVGAALQFQLISENWAKQLEEDYKMGWEGYESEMDIGMLLRKMYCQKRKAESEQPPRLRAIRRINAAAIGCKLSLP